MFVYFLSGPLRNMTENAIYSIQKNDSYRITVEKRNTSISTNEIITEVAKIFPNEVSLNKPDLIVLIEILGDKTGISILKDSELFSLDKSKRISD